jgi:hypothetical protein
VLVAAAAAAVGNSYSSGNGNGSCNNYKEYTCPKSFRLRMKCSAKLQSVRVTCYILARSLVGTQHVVALLLFEIKNKN